jgi:hypothetical protein
LSEIKIATSPLSHIFINKINMLKLKLRLARPLL